MQSRKICIRSRNPHRIAVARKAIGDTELYIDAEHNVTWCAI
jgi:hypothetical protein